MQIPRRNIYLLSIYVESVLKVLSNTSAHCGFGI